MVPICESAAISLMLASTPSRVSPLEEGDLHLDRTDHSNLPAPAIEYCTTDAAMYDRGLTIGL